MMRFWNEAEGRLGDAPSERWIDVDDPDEPDRDRLAALGVQRELVLHALDTHELPRTLQRGAATLVVLRYSVELGEGGAMPYAARPLGVVLLDGRVVTIGRGHQDVVGAAAERCPPTRSVQGFVLAIFAVVAERFLQHLERIDEHARELEERLQRSLDNREVMRLLHLQRSLTVFSTSLDLDEEALVRLREEHFRAPLPENAEALEDALVELRQAKHVAAVSSNLLGEMMDAFASIISNNLAVVVKVLSMVAVVLVVPTIIGTFYGMNVRLPLQDEPWVFWFLIAGSVVLSALVASWLWRRKWL